MAIEAERIFSWLPNVEGACSRRGYVPCYRNGGGTANYRGKSTGDPAGFRAMGASGVTIGVGVDLGQQTAEELERWGCPPSVLETVRPYIGKKKSAALVALYRQPLALSMADAKALTEAEQKGYLSDIVLPWWRNFAPNRPFGSMPWQAQAAVFSLVYQCGIKGALSRGPFTLGKIAAGEYQRAARALQDRSGWPDYQDRRAQEGRMLAGAVDDAGT